MLRKTLAALLVLLALGAAWEALTWSDVAGLARENPDTTAFMERYQALRRAAGEEAPIAWQWVPYEEISPHLKRAVLVAEDIGFFSHRGFAFEEIRTAVREALKGRQPPRGASTVTQQLAKNLWLSPSRNPLRKLKEAVLTWQLERRLSKRRILELYLNLVEFGPGIYGAEAASRRYFAKPAAALTPSEAARLAAVLPRPRSWHPGSDSRTYRGRVARIEARMEKASWLWQLI